jgi:guanylate kinase
MEQQRDDWFRQQLIDLYLYQAKQAEAAYAMESFPAWQLAPAREWNDEQAEEAGVTTRGTLVVLSGPSGSGKSSIQTALVEKGWSRVVSSTTRPMRAGETDGVDYNFYSLSEFEAIEAEEEFIETEDIYGNRYGLEYHAIESLLRKGKNAVVVLGIGGARQVKRLYPEALMVFIQPESRQALEQRLAARGADNRRVETIDARHVDFPVHEVTNRTGLIDLAVADIELLVRRERGDRSRPEGVRVG